MPYDPEIAKAAANNLFVATSMKNPTMWPEGSDSLLRSLLVDGIIGGVGGVIVFLPNIVLLFLGIALLEDTGYMARAAFLMDRIMSKMGLHGKSFIPMMIGFGCSVPAIMGTRILEDRKSRLITIEILIEKINSIDEAREFKEANSAIFALVAPLVPDAV